MQQIFLSGHNLDADGNPAGGYALARGVSVEWQNGPLGRGEERQEPNGAFVETVIGIALDRLAFYQQTRFACEQNDDAMQALHYALRVLRQRTDARETLGIEGTHQVPAADTVPGPPAPPPMPFKEFA